MDFLFFQIIRYQGQHLCLQKLADSNAVIGRKITTLYSITCKLSEKNWWSISKLQTEISVKFSFKSIDAPRCVRLQFLTHVFYPTSTFTDIMTHKTTKVRLTTVMLTYVTLTSVLAMLSLVILTSFYSHVNVRYVNLRCVNLGYVTIS